MPSIEIQKLDQRDPRVALTIHAIQMLAYAQEAALLGVKSLPPLERTPQDIQASPERFLGALIEDAIVGALSFELKEGPAIDIASLVVSPQWQRRGIGRLLVSAVLAEAQGREVSVSTGAKNEPALALYRESGFVVQSHVFLGPERLEVVRLSRQRSLGSAVPASHAPRDASS